MLRNKLLNLPRVVISMQNIHNNASEALSKYKYKKYTFVKYEATYNDNKNFLIENVIALKSFKTEEQKEDYLTSKQFNSFVRYYQNLTKHPKMLKIEKEEGDDYIVSIINYTHSSDDIKIGETIIKKYKIGTYINIKKGEEKAHYAVGIYKWKINKEFFHKHIKQLSKNEKEALGGYENMEKAAEFMDINPQFEFIDFYKCLGDTSTLQINKFKFKEVSNSNIDEL